MDRSQSSVIVTLFIVFLLFSELFAAGGDKKQPVSLPVKTVLTLTVTGGDTVSAKIQKAPVKDVLQELANQTDLVIEVDGSVEGEFISAEFDPLPLEEGIQNLLRNKSYVLVYKEVPSPTGSAPLLRVEGIKVTGTGKPGELPLRIENANRDKGFVSPAPTTLTSEPPLPSRPQDDLKKETRGFIFSAPYQPTNPQTTNPAFPGPGVRERNIGSGNTNMSRDAGQSTTSSPSGHTTTIPPSTDINTILTNKNATHESQSSDENDEESEPSIATLTKIATTDPDPETRMNALEDLVYSEEGGLKIIATLEQVALSDSDSEVRERARDLIESVREE